MYGNFKTHLANQLNQIYDDGLYKTDFQEGFDLMNSGKAGKIILNWD